MAPHGKAITRTSRSNNFNKPPRLSTDSLKRTMSDNISFQLMCREGAVDVETNALAPISEVEDAKCECCGMSEECTPEYIGRVRGRFYGKWICGLCGEAVKEEVAKNGGNREEALSAHMSACVRFNKFGRAYPILSQAEAMREMLKKARSEGRGVRAKSMSPRDHKMASNKGAISRSSSCIPAITRDMD